MAAAKVGTPNLTSLFMSLTPLAWASRRRHRREDTPCERQNTRRNLIASSPDFLAVPLHFD
jgi:hypothetical protein